MENITKRKLREAEYFLHKMKKSFKDDDKFYWNLSAFLSAARSITEYIEKQYAHYNGFPEWYCQKKIRMFTDPELKYLKKARDTDVHTDTHGKPLETGATRKIQGSMDAILVEEGTPMAEQVKEAEPKPPTQSSPKTVRRFFSKFGGVDVVPFCESQLGKLTKLVEECEKRFQAKPSYHKEVAMFEEDAVAFWQFQSKLMWSRIQTATVIEAGVLGGWYQLWRANYSRLAVAILVLGAVLLLVVSLLMHRDSQYMKTCETRAGERIPKPGTPILKVTGRQIAVLAPLSLAICDVVLVFMMKWFAP